MKNNKILIYLDPGYREDMGHYRVMAGVLKEECLRSNVNLFHFVSSDVSDSHASEYSLKKVFLYKSYILPRKQVRKYLKEFGRALDKILNQFSYSKDKIRIFMYTGDPKHFSIIARFVNEYKKKYNILDISAKVGLFRVDSEFCLGQKKMIYGLKLKWIDQKIEYFDKSRILSIMSDSQRIKNIYQPYFKRFISVFPLPIAKPIKETGCSGMAGDKLTLGYCGMFFKRFGYTILLKAIKKMNKSGMSDNIRFKIKVIPIGTSDKQINNFYNTLNGISHNIELMKGFASNEEQSNFLNKCDILLMPYLREYYKCRTSGLFVEALFNKKIVIVPEDTWMSVQLKQYGAGETFISGDPDSLVAAINKVLLNYTSYIYDKNRHTKFIRNHSSGLLLKKIFEH
jgi:glycosyltransferase involved in cell wall biosynthesis